MDRHPKKVMVYEYGPGKGLAFGVVLIQDKADALYEVLKVLAKVGGST